MAPNDIDWNDLPEDPEQAFIVVEGSFRRELALQISFTQERTPSLAYFEYTNNISAARLV
jgi:hypothetical protein